MIFKASIGNFIERNGVAVNKTVFWANMCCTTDCFGIDAVEALTEILKIKTPKGRLSDFSWYGYMSFFRQ